jgi:asparagine synthase (glutamine-hydrolysing)
MCGIAGLICSTDACCEADHISLLDRMNYVQRHRGPDDSGIVSFGQVYLGAVRLSIIDPTEAGHMPMMDEEGRWVIVYNGEVYNFQELREELAQCGHRFHSKTDTEIVLHAYAEWGDKCVERFVGMFAFAIYDRYNQTLVLVRDRYGIKPLYYSRDAAHIFFSSEVKALTKIYKNLKLNRQRLIEWSLYRNTDVLSGETLIENIYSVLPGHIVSIKSGQIDSRCYYSPPQQIDYVQFNQNTFESTKNVIKDVEAKLLQSVRDRLISDVPVGTLCSGGIDSSLITAFAARYHKQLTAFHVSVSGYPELDERLYAEQVTSRLGVPLVSHSLDGEGFRRELAHAIYLSDAPLTHPNSVAFLLICQIARQNGVLVLLSGEGADELFGGYAWRYRRYVQTLRAKRLLSFFPNKIRKAVESIGYASSNLPTTSFLFDQLLPHTVSFIDRFARQDWFQQCSEAYSFVTNPWERACLGRMLGDLTDFLTPLLRRLDRMSMGASIECRVPFLDHRLVRNVINLPLHYRIRGRTDKWLLKAIAARHLPRAIVKRRKVGFPLPIQDYLAPFVHGNFFHKGFCNEIIGLHARGIRETIASRQMNVQAFFNLVSLEIWGRLFIMQQPLEQVSEYIVKAEYTTALGAKKS